MLLVALAPGLPYGYYTLLRWVCCAVFVLLAYLAWSVEKPAGTWVLGFFALLFNPLVPVYLGREVWVVLDVIAAVVIAGSTWLLYKTGANEQNDGAEN